MLFPLFSLCLALTCLSGLADSQDLLSPRAKTSDKNLTTVLQEDGRFNSILTYLDSSGLLDILNNVTASPSFTLFLPTDDGIAANPDIAAKMAAEPSYMELILKFHVDNYEAVKMTHKNDKVLNTMALQPLRLNWYGNPLQIYAAEGVEVEETNIPVVNGYINALKGIMVPPEGNIPYIVSQRADMKILTSLIHVAGLTDTIREDQNMTLFAPTDAAFGKMSAEAQTYLQSNPDKLKEVILYHVIDRMTLYSIGMRHSMTFPTADRKHDRVMLMEDGTGNVFLNGGKISEVDISAVNGVIHVLDHVMVPVGILLEMEGLGITVIG